MFFSHILMISIQQTRQASLDGCLHDSKGTNNISDQDLVTAPTFLSISPTIENNSQEPQYTTPIVPLSQRFSSPSNKEEVDAPITRPRARTMTSFVMTRKSRANLVPTVFRYIRQHTYMVDNNHTQVHQEHPC